uniref:Uncharacterized protein n=1 Tax=Arundo donax TaxID=35708 RepID=A0A0A8XZK1_ARUDO
MPMLARNS